jgi:hypothetical protein
MTKNNKIHLITSTNAEAGTLETLPVTQNMSMMSSDDLLKSNLYFTKTDKVCITSESSIDVVISRMADVERKRAIEVLKDKFAFRKILTDIYPNYQYKHIDIAAIKGLSITKKAVIKPLKGCFGTAVRVIDTHTNVHQLFDELKADLDKNGAVFSDTVLSKNDFIIEDFISGEEYAVDMFYDDKGKPHIINIYHHPMPREEAYLHVVYCTSKDIFNRIYDKAVTFFTALNKILNVTNFLIHSEFRLHEGVLMPIEMNPMRFGGMGLGNMVYHGLGINPYTCFAQNKSPNWAKIWAKNPTDTYAFFIAYNGKSIDKNRFKPNIEQLKKEFTILLLDKIFDYKTQLAFGIFYIKETENNLKKLLNIEFDDFFELI